MVVCFRLVHGYGQVTCWVVITVVSLDRSHTHGCVFPELNDVMHAVAAWIQQMVLAPFIPVNLQCLIFIHTAWTRNNRSVKKHMQMNERKNQKTSRRAGMDDDG